MTKQAKITAAIEAAVSPMYLAVIDESHTHHSSSESHYKVVVVSDLFDTFNAVKRHQKIYSALTAAYLMDQIHALALHTYTPREWQGMSEQEKLLKSPICSGANH